MKYWLYSLCFPLHHCKLLISYLVVWTSPSPILSVFPYLFLLVTISLFSDLSLSPFCYIHLFYFLDSHVSENVQSLSFSVWLISLSIIPSRSKHIANGKFSYFYGWTIFFRVYILHLIYPFICCGTLRLLLYLG